MSRFFGALLGALLTVSVVQADSVTRAATPSLFIAPGSVQTLPQDPVPALGAIVPTRFVPTAPDIAANIETQSDINAFGFACGPVMSVTSKPGALLDIAISAPCKPDERVTINHAGLSFQVALSLTGAAQVMLPALAEKAVIDTIFEDQTRLTYQATVPDLNEYARFAIGWGQPHAQLVAQAPRHLPIAAFRLGEGEGQVQILSHHIDPEARAGVIRLSIHAQVTPENCNHSQQAHVVEAKPHDQALSYDLELVQPGCGRIGDNLVLKNILPDLKLAAN